MPIYIKKLDQEHSVVQDSHALKLSLYLPVEALQDSELGKLYHQFFHALGGFGVKWSHHDSELSSDRLLELSQRMFEIEQYEKKLKHSQYDDKSPQYSVDSLFTEYLGLLSGLPHKK